VVNDKPTNQRMGFGFAQAKAAGVPYVGARAVSAMNADLRERHFANALRVTLQKFPNFADLIEMAVKNGHSAEDIFEMIWPGWEDWEANYGEKISN
jgi:hypothetical protein